MDPPGGPPVDVMIGSRYTAGGGVEGWPLKRQLMSRAVNLYARTLLGLKPKDCSGAFRCYRVALLEKLDFNAVRSRGYLFQEEILWRLKRLGARFGETPIIFLERQHGVSKIDSGEALSAVRIIFALGLAIGCAARGVEAIGLDGPVGVSGEVAVFEMADGDDLAGRIGQRWPDVRRVAVVLDKRHDVRAVGQHDQPLFESHEQVIDLPDVVLGLVLLDFAKVLPCSL